MSAALLDEVASEIWRVSTTHDLARTWAEESLPVKQQFEVQARAALAVVERATKREDGSAS